MSVTHFGANVVSAVFTFARMNRFLVQRKVRCHKRSMFLVEKPTEIFRSNVRSVRRNLYVKRTAAAEAVSIVAGWRRD